MTRRVKWSATMEPPDDNSPEHAEDFDWCECGRWWCQACENQKQYLKELGLDEDGDPIQEDDEE